MVHAAYGDALLKWTSDIDSAKDHFLAAIDVTKTAGTMIDAEIKESCILTAYKGCVNSALSFRFLVYRIGRLCDVFEAELNLSFAKITAKKGVSFATERQSKKYLRWFQFKVNTIFYILLHF